MPKKLGDTGDFKPRKLPKPKVLGDYKPGNRFSFRVPGDKPKPETDCGNIDIPDYTRNNKGVGRPQGFAVEYSGEQLENYKKQYPRFERAINLIADARTEYDSGNIEYSFCSKQSPTGYWKVTILPGKVFYFLEAGEPLQILCPVPYQITQIESNGESFVWEQLEGGRLAAVDPPDAIDPVLYVLDDVRDTRPIRFKIFIKDKPEISDELIIYTTPTEEHSGIGFTQLTTSNKVFPIPASVSPPIYLQRVYLIGDRGFTWNPPSVDAEYVVGYAVQQNSTGQYVDIQSYGKPGIFIGQPNSYYRIKILFSSFGLDYESYSDILIYPAAFTPPTVIADDYTKGISFNYLNNAIVDLPLAVQKIQVTDIDTGIAFNYLNNSIIDLPLSVQRIESLPDIHNGLAFTYLRNDITDIPLGGVIIG